MRKVHRILAWMDEIDNSLVYRHSRHAKGECPWCDFIRVGEVSREFMRRLSSCGVRIDTLHMWSLGTSLKDSDFNRKILRGFYRKFKNVMNKRAVGWNPVFWVVEAGRRGFIHMHVVLRTYCPHDIVLRAWRFQTGESSNVHVRTGMVMDDPRRLASYLLKYLSKESSTYAWCGCFQGLGPRGSNGIGIGAEKPMLVYMGETCYTMETDPYPGKKRDKLY